MRAIYGEDVVEVRNYTVEAWGISAPDPARHRMAHLYTSLNERDTVYVKIDDDIVYLARHAIPELVREKLRDRCLFVSGNVVNHAILSSVHQERGAHRAFEPGDADEGARQPWHRVGDVNFDSSYVFERHPMGSCVLRRWDCAAIAHESFLDRHSEGTLCAFDFGWLDFNRVGYREHTYVHLSPWAGKTWETRGARWSINFFAFRGDDMRGVDWSRVFGPGDDEEEFGGPHGERRDRHACALGRSLAVHFSYNTQEERLSGMTNLLERYTTLAEIVEVPEFKVS
eukprot:TRINITY_DN22138_c0_g1_i1.p1 TRINITY_DN22138_c0_g1~~TRINITY_DN22138_c0_g1_i1.p1  ORF type:complete len:284 (+),score=56.32 TRINITY_DN22138_c0_g1_i1:155-1006(+)